MNDLQAIRDALARPAPNAGLPPTSAVLLPIVPHPAGARILYTVRTAHLSSHAGEISFPGGRIEAGETPRQAALRETMEEIGVPETRIDVLGHLVDFLTFRGTAVSCWVGAFRRQALERPIARNDEVEEAFLVPIDRLARPQEPGRVEPQVITDVPIPVALEDVVSYEQREFEGASGPERRIHYWRLSNGRTLWGITAHLTALFLERVEGWSPPVPARRISRREDVYP